jgi:FtsH-binding integral membrane protein
MSSKSFIPIVYLHLLTGTALTFGSSQYPLATGSLYTIGVGIATFPILFALFFLSPGPLKYVVAALFCAALGQMLSTLVKKLEYKQLLTQVLASVLGIFAAMTVAGFVDNQNLLGFGGYLFAGLVGLILARVGLLIAMGFGFGADSKTVSTFNAALSWIGTALFSVYVAYDTQRLKVDARSRKAPDYVDSSLGLYLDFINLFQNVADITDT